jgi:hypothetical protein
MITDIVQKVMRRYCHLPATIQTPSISSPPSANDMTPETTLLFV